MSELSPQEAAIFDQLTDQHKALLGKLNKMERGSLAKYVTPENIDTIQSWIGNDQEIEQMLFWDQGGKYDDAAWQVLKPFDQPTADLYDRAISRYAELKVEAVESQRRSDITLYSQFNTGLLFTGLAGAVRCGVDGKADGQGGCYKGIEWRLIGSIEDEVNSLTIWPVEEGFEVHLGSRKDGLAQGICVYTGDVHSLLMLAQLAAKVLPKSGFDTKVIDLDGNEVELNPRAIRAAAMGDGAPVDFGRELMLYASAKADDAGEALKLSEVLACRIYERFGLEIEAHKIGRLYGNFFIMREDNFETFLPQGPTDKKALILLTATLVCRRCRRELEEFRDAARDYPQAEFVLVNLSSPQFKFYERVFGDMGGGDADEFRKNAAGVTPFIIVYTADEEGVLRFDKYIATAKEEGSPSLRTAMKELSTLF